MQVSGNIVWHYKGSTGRTHSCCMPTCPNCIKYTTLHDMGMSYVHRHAMMMDVSDIATLTLKWERVCSMFMCTLSRVC